MRCPSCMYENISGADSCEQCGLSLMQEDTNPENRVGPDRMHIVTDPIYKVELPKAAIVHPTATIKFALLKMKELTQDCVLVVDRGDIVGIFTERDVLKKITSPNIDLDEIEIQQFMTVMPEVLHEDDAISYAFNKMAMGNFRHVPIRRRDGSHAVFSVRDALNYLF